MSFIFFLLMIAVGLWLIRRNNEKTVKQEIQHRELIRSENKRWADKFQLQQARFEGLSRAAEEIAGRYTEDKDKLNALMKGNRLTENTELDKLILENALKRETRAKAALRHVMVADRCSEEDIGKVMAAIDKED